jgi:hypothetical protein
MPFWDNYAFHHGGTGHELIAAAVSLKHLNSFEHVVLLPCETDATGSAAKRCKNQRNNYTNE